MTNELLATLHTAELPALCRDLEGLERGRMVRAIINRAVIYG